tara:strand:- start:1603 stop:1782 length:180 start_codon:yes stop_codon:yes gene_type:complete
MDGCLTGAGSGTVTGSGFVSTFGGDGISSMFGSVTLSSSCCAASSFSCSSIWPLLIGYV